MEHRFQPEELVRDKSIFGPALARVRTALGVSQRELGDHALVAASTIATYETEAREPSIESIVGLAVACGVEPPSAARHGRLLTEGMQIVRGLDGTPMLVPESMASAAARGALHALEAATEQPLLLPLPGRMLALAMAGSALAGAVTGGLRPTVFSDRTERKLLTRALDATPLPQLTDQDIYPLMTPRPRRDLERDLRESAKRLSDDQLESLVAALNATTSSPDDD